MTITLDAKRRLTVPLPLMRGAQPGDIFVARYDLEEDTLTFRRLPPREDWLKVVGLCPGPVDEAPAPGTETHGKAVRLRRPRREQTSPAVR
ncbi:MAG: hypothetical protein JSR82_10395 [Verrucomicrobia bacterium]|nr:hypothetical protein [Verrucomicrobiota bacterium]